MTINQFGFEQGDWETAKAEAKQLLAGCARRRQMIPYSDFVSQIRAIALEAYDLRLNHFLGEISSEEDAAGRGMLSALVVHKHGDYQPGPGFFELAEALGRDTSGIVKCWIEEVKRVFSGMEVIAGCLDESRAKPPCRQVLGPTSRRIPLENSARINKLRWATPRPLQLRWPPLPPGFVKSPREL